MEKLKKIFRNTFNPKDIYSTHRPMLLTYCFEGLFPFHFNKDKDQLEPSKIGFSFTVIKITLYFASFFQTVFKNQSFVVYFFQTEISVYGGYLQFAASCAAMVTLYSTAIFRRDKIRLVFESLYEVDKQFKILCQGIDHKAVLHLILISAIVLYSLNLTFVLMSLLLLSVGTDNEYPGFVVWWSFFHPYLVLALVVVKFTTVLAQILQRFRALNKVRRRHYDTHFIMLCINFYVYFSTDT